MRVHAGWEENGEAGKKSHATWSHRPPVRPHADAVYLSIQRSEKLVVARPASAPKVYDGSAPALFVFILSHGSGPACFVSPYPLDLRVVGRRARRAALLRIPLLCYLPPPRCNRRLRLPRFPRLESLLVKGKVYTAMYELSSDDETCVLTVGITPAIFFSGLLKLLAMMCGMRPWPSTLDNGLHPHRGRRIVANVASGGARHTTGGDAQTKEPDQDYNF
jgi:hypothetical protein